MAPKKAQPPLQLPAERQPFRDRYRSLVWSNPDADDSIYLRRALLQPTFQMLLDGAVEFGLPRLEQESEPLSVATLDEIFATKCLACADRSKQRDWFDLFILLTGHGYTFDDVHRIFIQAKRPGNFGIAADRLRLCRPGLADEGYEALLPEAPSLDELRAFFNRELDRFEVRLAAAAFKAQHAATNVRKKPKRD